MGKLAGANLHKILISIPLRRQYGEHREDHDNIWRGDECDVEFFFSFFISIDYQKIFCVIQQISESIVCRYHVEDCAIMSGDKLNVVS